MKHVLKNERGMALALAIVALVIVGALVAGALFSGTQEQRVAENVRRVQASFGVAEEGAFDIIRGWGVDTTKQKYAALFPYPAKGPPGKDTVLYGMKTAASGTGSYSGSVMKLNDEMFVVDISGQDAMSMTGRIRGGGASQRVGVLTRIKPLQVNTNAALTSGGTNVVVGNASIDGNDHNPWTTCAPLDSAKPGIRYQVGDTVSASGHPSIAGSPPTLRDPNLKDSAFSVYGDVTYTQMVQNATINLDAQNFANSIGPALSNGACDYSVSTNWGSPTNPTGPCGGYFPIIHIAGTGSVINGQEGQGILLVDGSLNIQGGFQFFGIVIIKGSLKTAGGGGNPAHFWGSVMVQDTISFSDTTNNISGAANLLYSKCAIIKALNKTGYGTQFRSRGWTQLY